MCSHKAILWPWTIRKHSCCVVSLNFFRMHPTASFHVQFLSWFVSLSIHHLNTIYFMISHDCWTLFACFSEWGLSAGVTQKSLTYNSEHTLHENIPPQARTQTAWPHGPMAYMQTHTTTRGTRQDKFVTNCVFLRLPRVQPQTGGRSCQTDRAVTWL